MLQRRPLVLIDDQHDARLGAIAKERGMSTGTVVREATDRGLVSREASRAAAGASILAAASMPVPNVDNLLTELGERRGGRGAKGISK